MRHGGFGSTARRAVTPTDMKKDWEGGSKDEAYVVDVEIEAFRTNKRFATTG